MENEEFSDQPEISFDEVIAAMRDETVPFPARYLYRLSLLEGENLGFFRRIWFDLSAQRRLGLLQDLETLAESNTVMHFEAVNEIALEDEDAQVRETAIRALWNSEDSKLLPRFFDLLENDASADVRAQAASTLGRFVYLGEVGKISGDTAEQIEALLLKTLEDDEDPLVQRRSLESLGYASRPEVAELIEKAYSEDDNDWVASALYAMGRSADDRWAPLVIERLRDPVVEVSREAARAAGELELNDALPTLAELLRDEDSELRLAAAWSLSQIGGEGVEDALDDLLERTEDEDEIDLIEDAIENLAFTHEMADMNILDFSPDDLDEMAHPEVDDAILGEDPAAD